MQHTTKMVMVPQDAYSSLVSQQKQLYPPVIGQLSNLDQELQTILTNPNLSTDAKYHQYMNVFGRYQKLKQGPEPPQLQAPPPPPIEERNIVSNLPKAVQRKGKILMDHIRANPEVFTFQKTGELVVNGSPVVGSNVTDLIHYATRTRPNVTKPEGYDQFKDLLDATNVPKEAVRANTRPVVFSTPPSGAFGTSPSGAVGTSFSPKPKRNRQPPKVFDGGKWTPYKKLKK